MATASNGDLPNLRDFQRVVFFTGAGMSAESGVPTYRGSGGIWKDYDMERYACQEAFERDPDAVWDFHNYRRGLVAACAPNSGHALIARAEAVLPHVTVVTQNIDGLHQRAGSRRVHELHGSLWRVRCGNEYATDRAVPFTARRTDGRWWRPDIVWFGDCLSNHTVDAAVQAIRSCDLLVSIGTSAVVYPAAELPLLAKQNMATLIEINPDATPVSHAYDICVRRPAGVALADLCRGLDAAPSTR